MSQPALPDRVAQLATLTLSIYLSIRKVTVRITNSCLSHES